MRPCPKNRGKKSVLETSLRNTLNLKSQSTMLAPRASRAGLAAAGAAGVLCVVVLAVWQVSPLELLQSADRSGSMAGRRMIAMGKELEREGAEVAGARLIKQANKLIGRYYGKIARNAHNLKKTVLTRHPEDIGFSGHTHHIHKLLVY